MNRLRIEPGPGQESVWDYPRPPRLEDCPKHIQVIFNGIAIADTRQAKRLLETSHPPTYYFPPEDIKLEHLIATHKKNICEWKGAYQYYDIKIGDQLIKYAAWQYFAPTPNFMPMREYYGFIAALMDACYVNDELVKPQSGDFYGGWITADIVGPFKGEPGTWGW